jgi:hypothetical protein
MCPVGTVVWMPGLSSSSGMSSCARTWVDFQVVLSEHKRSQTAAAGLQAK